MGPLTGFRERRDLYFHMHPLNTTLAVVASVVLLVLVILMLVPSVE